MSALLQLSWRRAWASVQAQGDGSDLFEALVRRYSEAHRRYHSMQHLEECITTFEGAPETGGVDRGAIEMALWFHDGIYDLRASDNEARSAEWAHTALQSCGVPSRTAEAVARLVRATAHTAAPVAADECLLIDVDLSILGANAQRFAEYEDQIRAEYSFVPAEVFITRRKTILQSLLARPRLFSTEFFHQQLEHRARANLESAIAGLG